MRDLSKEYDSYVRSLVAVVTLAAQIVAVALAALCTAWWHFIILALVCFMFTPLWSSIHVGVLERWWKDHEDDGDLTLLGDNAEQIEDSIDTLDGSLPANRNEMPRNWPYGKK